MIITALRGDDGALIGFAKVTRDLTERKQAEERLRELAAERAALAEKARVQECHERFGAILGHDLRNPLAAIDMRASLLKGKAVDATSERTVDRIEASARRMSRMIEQILDLTRTRLGGGLEVRPATLDIASMLSAILDELRIAHPGRNLMLSFPPVTGLWDRDRLEQVFSNLAGNAIHYGAGTTVTVTGETKGDDVVVSIHNGGPRSPSRRRESCSIRSAEARVTAASR